MKNLLDEKPELTRLSSFFDSLLENVVNKHYFTLFKKDIEKVKYNTIFICVIGKLFLTDDFKKIGNNENITINIPTHVLGEKSSIRTNFEPIYFDDTEESFIKALDKAIIQLLTKKEN